MNPLAVAIFHGMGAFDGNFANSLIGEIDRRLARRFGGTAEAPQIVYQPVQWGDVLEPNQAELLRKILGDPSLGWRKLRSVLVTALGDAIAFHPTPDNRKDYDSVRDRVREQLSVLSNAAGPDAPLCLIAHSFGSIVATNYLISCQNAETASYEDDSPLVHGRTLATLITLGSPLALWSLRSTDYGEPLRLPAAGLRAQYPLLEGAWLNLYDSNDVLGYPLRNLNAAFAEAVLDLPVKTAGPLASWSPFSHFGYWDNETVISTIVASLSVLWRQTRRSANGKATTRMAPGHEGPVSV